MTVIHIENHTLVNSTIPDFSIDLQKENVTAIYSDVDLQTNMMQHLRNEKQIHVIDFQTGLYARLSVKDNLQFYARWFANRMDISDLLTLFDLHSCAEKPIQKCSSSEIRRVAYAHSYLLPGESYAFLEPIQQMDIHTVNVFRQLLKRMANENKKMLLIVSSMEHAILLGDYPYHLTSNGLKKIESEQEETNAAPSPAISDRPVIEKLFKIPAKVDDKVILFDPTEIDYIESQSGKSFIHVQDESFALDLTLTEIEQKLELYGFYRCHRSYIVNLQKVREIITWSQNTYSLRIHNKAQSTIPLSRAKLHVIQAIFNLK